MRRIALILIVALLAGCVAGAPPVVWIEKGASLANYRVVAVNEVANETGQTFEFDVAHALTEKVRSKLIERGIALSQDGSGGAQTLALRMSLTAYAPGNAAARWLLPGAGATDCIVKGALEDGQSRAQLGVILSHRSVPGGGLYSVGADKYILDAVATDIADGLANALKQR